MVDLPLWKIWVRQLGLLFPIYGNIENVWKCSKPPTSVYIYPLIQVELHPQVESPVLEMACWGTNRGHLLKGNNLPNQAPKDGSPTLLPSYTPIREISPICTKWLLWIYLPNMFRMFLLVALLTKGPLKLLLLKNPCGRSTSASELQAQLFQDRFVAWPPEGILLEGASISKSAPATNDHQTYPPSKKTDANDANLRFPQIIYPLVN